MTSLTRSVWDREFDLSVRFEDLDNVGVSEEQWEALGKIIVCWGAIEDALSALKDYCLGCDCAMMDEESISNIFRYVIPKCLFVPQGTSERTIALMCDYRFDPEHGIAIVFENEKLKEIGMQDIVL